MSSQLNNNNYYNKFIEKKNILKIKDLKNFF